MSSLPSPRRSYITQFDALRFFAAITIAAFHGEVMKIIYRAPGGRRLYNWSSLGEHCVTLFFVLSGFLITWLLLRERDKTQTVDVRAFYLRRVFRIWPLYYLTLVLGLYVVPFSDHIFLPGYVQGAAKAMTGGEAVLWFTFFSNLYSAGLLSFQLMISHVWSIGAEEQFYVFGPWLVRKLRRPYLGMAALVLLFVVLRYGVYALNPSEQFEQLVEAFRFDCMAIGGLFA